MTCYRLWRKVSAIPSNADRYQSTKEKFLGGLYRHDFHKARPVEPELSPETQHPAS
jgi:hypothetical protein